jgi:hypothetical protein
VTKVKHILAIHEAGHAVVGWLYGGIKLKEIVVGNGRDPVEGDVLGYVKQKCRLPRGFCDNLETGFPESKDWVYARNLIVSLAAGTAAEWRLNGYKGKVWRAGSDQDERSAREIADRMHRGNYNLGLSFLTYCADVAKDEADRRWRFIESVASELKKTEVMRWQDFQEIISNVR